ncbi:DNA-directed RNA polymerase subunit delta [Mycoplasmopsis columbinasalis]|uniref:RNAP delta factor n=1 Tax=Mycoplasmopsis columbinasalis TaxID=114880 RepID=A0A449BAH6_9BACT|nr:hypothetical protein [Mycoplasmopsis columbinasalis]VEU78166.1 Uncharacterised protein [Mycoplasmopsis columbinasalis]
MRTILDIALDYMLASYSSGKYADFTDIFAFVENELGSKWREEAEEKNVSYETISEAKIGELYRLLTVDSRFLKGESNAWTIRPGYKK